MINEVSTRFGRNSARRTSRRGFTLVELLVCIGLLLMLMAILLPAARRSIESARQAACLNNLRQIAQATLMYAQDNENRFPGMAGVEQQPDGGPLIDEWIYAESQLNQAPFNDVSKSLILRYLGNRDLGVLHCPSDDPQTHVLQPWKLPYGIYPYSYAISEWTCRWPTAWGSRFQYQQQYKSNPARYPGYNIFPAYRIEEVKNPSQTFFFVDEDPRFIDDGSFLNLPFTSANPANPDITTYEPASCIHDVYRTMRDAESRCNMVFCDGHGEFVTQQSLWDPAHYNPEY